jgi:hypothetical protein
MLLADVLAKLDDEACVNEVLLGLDDLVLANRVADAAAEHELTAGEFALRSVGNFARDASDEEWLTLIGLMSRAEDPARVFLHRALSNTLGMPEKE